MATIVRETRACAYGVLTQMWTGELLEKVTRVLTPEEQAIMDTEWVGKDGSRRKLEV